MVRERYIVEIERPVTLTQREVARYIRDAVNGWSGGYAPWDYRANIPQTAKVSKPRRKRKTK